MVSKTIYQAVTKDKYELPVAQAESPTALSLKLGLSMNVVNNYLKGKIKIGKTKYKFVEVVIDDEC